ncbi:twin-arginine translocation signal domain-containing protein, partial [Dietzia schimae]
MCRDDNPTHGPTLTRREALAGAGMVAAAGAVGVTLLAEPAPVWANPVHPVADDLDVYVIVTDGMRPDELNPAQAPTLHRWATEGTRFTDASSVMIAETLPNHAAMVTGVLPARNGVPANTIWDHAIGDERTLDRPDDLRAATVLDRIRTEAGLTTASVLSKDYLHGLFGGRASVQWAPFPLVPVTDHSLDWFTVEALKQTITDHSPRMTFV